MYEFQPVELMPTDSVKVNNLLLVISAKSFVTRIGVYKSNSVKVNNLSLVIKLDGAK